MKPKVLTIIGARPQFVKAATISREFANYSGVLDEVLVHTGQHFDHKMSDIFFDELQIPQPKYNLDINNLGHGAMTGQMLSKLEELMLLEKPTAVLVYGDTNSTLAGSLAAAKLNIDVFHIEAGLRSFNKRMPEEINRILTDNMSKLLFCPTKQACINLQKENIRGGVYHSGDVMYDATLHALDMVKENDIFSQSIPKDNFAVLTLHRQETTDNHPLLTEMLQYIVNFSKAHHLKIVFPVHPRFRKLLAEYPDFDTNVFNLIEPLGYFEMQKLLSKASYILTDSGGIQKEAYFHKVPCITMRTETEWVETIECGWNRLWTEDQYKPRAEIDEYGGGKASQNIVSRICQHFNL